MGIKGLELWGSGQWLTDNNLSRGEINGQPMRMLLNYMTKIDPERVSRKLIAMGHNFSPVFQI